MKYDFQNLNIAPMPNPKPIAVERIRILTQSENGEWKFSDQGIVRNSSLHPYAVINGEWGFREPPPSTR